MDFLGIAKQIVRNRQLVSPIVSFNDDEIIVANFPIFLYYKRSVGVSGVAVEAIPFINILSKLEDDNFSLELEKGMLKIKSDKFDAYLRIVQSPLVIPELPLLGKSFDGSAVLEMFDLGKKLFRNSSFGIERLKDKLFVYKNFIFSTDGVLLLYRSLTDDIPAMSLPLVPLFDSNESVIYDCGTNVVIKSAKYKEFMVLIPKYTIADKEDVDPVVDFIESNEKADFSFATISEEIKNFISDASSLGDIIGSSITLSPEGDGLVVALSGDKARLSKRVKNEIGLDREIIIESPKFLRTFSLILSIFDEISVGSHFLAFRREDGLKAMLAIQQR